MCRLHAPGEVFDGELLTNLSRRRDVVWHRVFQESLVIQGIDVWSGVNTAARYLQRHRPQL
jgi:hypothetical protein